jgi:hypothetical protein
VDEANRPTGGHDEPAGTWTSGQVPGVAVAWRAPWSLATEAAVPGPDGYDLLRLTAGRLATEVYALPWEEIDPPAILRRFLAEFRRSPDPTVTQEWNRGGARPIPMLVEFRRDGTPIYEVLHAAPVAGGVVVSVHARRGFRLGGHTVEELRAIERKVSFGVAARARAGNGDRSAW